MAALAVFLETPHGVACAGTGVLEHGGRRGGAISNQLPLLVCGK